MSGRFAHLLKCRFEDLQPKLGRLNGIKLLDLLEDSLILERNFGDLTDLAERALGKAEIQQI